MSNKVPVCSECGSEEMEKIVWTKSVAKFQWNPKKNDWNWRPLSKVPIFPHTKKARHWCKKCNYYRRLNWRETK